MEGRFESIIFPENFSESESLERCYKLEFAKELRTPENKSFLTKLQHLFAAFILSGLVLFSPAKKVIAPELSIEYLEAENILTTDKVTKSKKPTDYYQQYRRTLERLRTKRGIKISSEAEQLFKPANLAKEAELLEKHRNPLDRTTENFFGKYFVQENPQKAKEYTEKIKQAMAATVIIGWTPEKVEEKTINLGGGVIIQTEKNQIIVLTNKHVIEASKRKSGKPIIRLYNGINLTGKIIARDSKRDLIAIKIILPMPQFAQKNLIKQNKILEGFLKKEQIIPLRLALGSPASRGNTFALIGHPWYFPYEAMFAIYQGEESSQKYYPQTNFSAIHCLPDNRFATLSLFELQGLGQRFGGEGMQGISGGPIINLDQATQEVALEGINCFIAHSSKEEQKSIFKWPHTFGVSAKDIKNFLAEKGI